MTIRERIEREERQRLLPLAVCSSDTRGRERPLAPCALRTEFQRDRDRIIHSKSFRRLKYKTQCFLPDGGDHFRTRLTHTLEVSQVARTLARALRLNEDLAEAIALGHDLGHTCFGHMGERTLNRLCPEGFRHNEQSLRVVEFLERDGDGLNLCWEVRDGILNHGISGKPSTLEGQIVSLSDRIAYLSHDIDDAIRAAVLSEQDIPLSIREALGSAHGERIDAMISDTVNHSMDQPEIGMSERVRNAFTELRAFMFEKVYARAEALEEEGKADRILSALYAHYMENHSSIAGAPDIAIHRKVCDFLAGMTDRFALGTYRNVILCDIGREDG